MVVLFLAWRGQFFTSFSILPKKYTRGDADMFAKHDLAKIFNWLEIPHREVRNLQKKRRLILTIMSRLFSYFTCFTVVSSVKSHSEGRSPPSLCGRSHCDASAWTDQRWWLKKISPYMVSSEMDTGPPRLSLSFCVLKKVPPRYLSKRERDAWSSPSMFDCHIWSRRKCKPRCKER